MSFNINQLVRRTPGFVPDGVYTILIHSCVAGKSRAGNHMATLDCEVISPAEVAALNAQGQVVMYATAHTKFRAWWTLALNEYLSGNVDKLVSMGVNLADEYASGPNEMIEDIMSQLPELLNRKYIEASLSTRQEFATRPLTAQQAAEGKTEGDIILDPATRQPKVLRHSIQMNLEGVIAGPSDEATPF